MMRADLALRQRSAPSRTTRQAVLACIWSVALIALAVLTGCGGGDSAGAAPTSSAPASGSAPAASGDAVIMIKNFEFTTPPSVSPGAKVTVDNMDGLAHTVSADKGGAFDSPAPAGKSSFTAPTKPGSYPFHCNIHPEMHGTLVVK
jgi:plastocyanin